jgi:hypothetical protein
MAITTPARVRNRIQAAEADISEDVLNEFIAEQTSKPSSKRMPVKPSRILTHKRSPNPIHSLDSRVRSAPTDAQPKHYFISLRPQPASPIRSTSSKSTKPIQLMPSCPWQNRCGRMHAGREEQLECRAQECQSLNHLSCRFSDATSDSRTLTICSLNAGMFILTVSHTASRSIPKYS